MIQYRYHDSLFGGSGQAELFAGGKPKHLAHGGEVSDLIGRLNVKIHICQNDFRDADAA